MHRIRSIARQNDYQTIFYTLNNLHDVIRDIFHTNHVQVQFRLINTIMIITYKICKH